MTKKQPIDLECKNCIHRKTCLNVQPGKFCTSFASKEPPAKSDADDPNLKWRRGEDVDLQG